MNKLQYYSVLMGCDPEFFISKNGNILGSEKVIPKDGLNSKEYQTCKVIRDGVQAELNPPPNTCRQSLSAFITECFKSLNTQMKTDPSLSLDFNGVVKVRKEELKSLSPESAVFGCAPSENFYEKAKSKITVDPKKYLYRSAGGHIHLGYADGMSINNKWLHNWLFSKKFDLRKMNHLDSGEGEGLSIHELNKDTVLSERIKKFYGISKIESITVPPVVNALKQPDKLIPLLDILVGNTCVLIDKDICNKERRKVYGRAGEYRLTNYGVEYRTLSNFWLKSYQLTSLVFGLARLSVVILANSMVSKEKYYESIVDAVNKDDIEKAINENDFDLAYQNFLKIKIPLVEMTKNDYSFSFFQEMTNDFEYFISHDISYWFKEPPLEHWLKETRQIGWERFITEIVRKERLEKEKFTGIIK